MSSSRRQWLIDLLGDVLDGMSARPGRSLLLVVVFAVGSGGFVAAAGVSLSAAQQITQRLTPPDLDEVVVREQVTGDLPSDAITRAEAVDVVRGAGTVRVVEPGRISVSVLPEAVGRPATQRSAAIYGADPDWVRLQQPVVTPPASIDLLSGAPAQQVALVGAHLAGRLHLPGPGPEVSIWVGSTSFDVVGIIASADRDPRLADSVVVPSSAVGVLAPDSLSALTVRTDPGASAEIAGMIAITVRPDRPTALDVDPVLDVEDLRRGVRTDLDRGIALVSVLVLAFAALTCGNVMVVAVIARTGEIGLRRALGASRSAIAALFLTEGAITGLAGGLLGSALGVVTVVGVAAGRGWTPAVSPLTLPLGPVVGLVVGVVAATYPALRAAGTQPALAVRHGG